MLCESNYQFYHDDASLISEREDKFNTYNELDLIDEQLFVQHDAHCRPHFKSIGDHPKTVGNESFITVGGSLWCVTGSMFITIYEITCPYPSLIPNSWNFYTNRFLIMHGLYIRRNFFGRAPFAP